MQGLQNPKGFIHTATHVVIGHHLVTDDPLRIDNEQTALGNTFVFVQHSISTAHAVCRVGGEGVFDLTQTVFIPGSVDPGAMNELRVSADTDDVTVSSRNSS